MYPTDAVSWIFTIWKNPPDYLVNIGSKHSITIRNLAETISTFLVELKLITMKLQNYLRNTCPTLQSSKEISQ